PVVHAPARRARRLPRHRSRHRSRHRRDFAMTDRGTYVEHDGRPAVRFTRRYPHSADRVWAAVSEPAGLQHWFPSRVELEPRVGGRIAFRDDPNLPEETSGTVL